MSVLCVLCLLLLLFFLVVLLYIENWHTICESNFRIPIGRNFAKKDLAKGIASVRVFFRKVYTKFSTIMHSQNYKFTYVKPVSGLKRHVDATFFRLGKSTPLAVILFCGLIFLGSVTAFAQITAGATASGFSTGSTTLTFPHTPGAGTNKLLLVAVGIGGIDGNPGHE